MDVVNIIVPITNLANNLQNLESWLNFPHTRNLAIIIVHDISENQTGKAIRELINNHSELDIQLIEGHFGSPGIARNAGLEAILNNGWVSFWDGDDVPLVENFIEMVNLAELNNKEIAAGGFEVVDLNLSKQFSREVHLFSGQGSYSEIALFPGIWRWAFKKQRIRDKVFKNFMMGEDQEFLDLLDIEIVEIYFYENSVYKYFVNRFGQLTSNVNSVEQLAATMKIILDFSTGYKSQLGQALFLRQTITLLVRGTLREKLRGISHLHQFTRSDSSRFRIYYFLTKNLIQLVIFYSRRTKTIQFFLFGGLGNQLFQLRTALAKTEGKPVILNVSLLKQAQLQSADLLDFNIPANVHFLLAGHIKMSDRKILNSAIRYSASNKKVRKSFSVRNWLGSVLRFLLTIKFGGSWFINSGVGADLRLKESRATNYLGYFQFANMELTQTSGQFNLELKNTSLEFRQIRSTLEINKSVLVQIRMGDYVNEEKIGHLGTKYFETQLQAAFKDFEYRRIYLFSDNVDLALKSIPSNLRQFVHIIDSDTLKASELLELMRYASHYIISNSTFGWWGAYLSYATDPVIVVPEPWFAKFAEPKNLIPTAWQKASRDGV